MNRIVKDDRSTKLAQQSSSTSTVRLPQRCRLFSKCVIRDSLRIWLKSPPYLLSTSENTDLKVALCGNRGPDETKGHYDKNFNRRVEAWLSMNLDLAQCNRNDADEIGNINGADRQLDRKYAGVLRQLQQSREK